LFEYLLAKAVVRSDPVRIPKGIQFMKPRMMDDDTFSRFDTIPDVWQIDGQAKRQTDTLRDILCCV